MYRDPLISLFSYTARRFVYRIQIVPGSDFRSWSRPSFFSNHFSRFTSKKNCLPEANSRFYVLLNQTNQKKKERFIFESTFIQVSIFLTKSIVRLRKSTLIAISMRFLHSSPELHFSGWKFCSSLLLENGFLRFFYIGKKNNGVFKAISGKNFTY